MDNLQNLKSCGFLLVALTAAIAQDVAVLSINLDGAQRSDTWAQYNDPFIVPGDSTVCLRFKMHVVRLINAVAYVLDTNDPSVEPISFEAYFEKIKVRFGGYERFYAIPNNLIVNHWYHYCQVRDQSSGLAKIFLNGKMLINETVKFDNKERLRKVIIGQNDYQPEYSFSGQITQFNVWGETLKPEKIFQIANCNDFAEGGLLAWSKMWILNNVNFTENIAVKKLCEKKQVEGIVRLPKLRYWESVRVCRSLGGYIPLPTTLEEMKTVTKYFKGPDYCNRIFASANDEEHEDIWKDPFTGKIYKAHELFWQINNPDGGIYQNCLRVKEEGLLDTDCPQPTCSPCYVTEDQIWTLRGICEEEERMNFMRMQAHPLAFFGFGEYAITKINGLWRWHNTITKITMATYLAEPPELPFPSGRRKWRLEAEVCGLRAGDNLTLALTPCQKNQFTCTDGQCVPFSSRCDLKFDCDDKTDESLCDIVNFPSDYRKKLPPRPSSNSALPVAVNVTIVTLNVDTQTMLISASYNLRMTWFDNRLTYNNLKSLTRLNTLKDEQVDALWKPLIGFINTDDIQQTSVDSDSVSTIVKQASAYQPDLANVYEVEIYSGDENPVSTTRKYFTVYTCNFDLTHYPFDIQECVITLRILSASNEYLNFNDTSSFVEYLGSKYLVEYGIGQISLRFDNNKQYSEAEVSIEFVRRYGYAMFNIYIPSVTLIIISFLTLFFKPTIFEVRVMTALTALLVLATLFSQASQFLPKTSYFKVVDIWLLFCIIIIFLIILFHTVIDIYADDHEHKEDQTTTKKLSWVDDYKVNIAYLIKYRLPKTRKDKLKLTLLFSKVISLTLFALFNVIYWGVLAVNSGLVYSY